MCRDCELVLDPVWESLPVTFAFVLVRERNKSERKVSTLRPEEGKRGTLGREGEGASEVGARTYLAFVPL